MSMLPPNFPANPIQPSFRRKPESRTAFVKDSGFRRNDGAVGVNEVQP